MTGTETKTRPPTVDAAFEQVKGFNEQFLGAARQAGTLYLDAYEKAIEQTIELELRVAGMTQQEWLRSVIEKQAEFTRELTSSYTSTARSLLKYQSAFHTRTQLEGTGGFHRCLFACKKDRP